MAHLIYWLVLITANGNALHVGNFSAMDSCKTAASQAQLLAHSGGPLAYNLMCIQANDQTTDPPASLPKSSE